MTVIIKNDRINATVEITGELASDTLESLIDCMILAGYHAEAVKRSVIDLADEYEQEGKEG